MIAIHNMRYKNGICQTLYSKDGIIWYLDLECTKIALDKYIKIAA